MTIRVGVVGAAGRMGQLVCGALLGASDFELVAAVSPRHARLPLARVSGLDTALVIAAELAALKEAEADVAVDFTVPEVVGENVSWYLEHGINAVVGTTGWTSEDLPRFAELSREHGGNAIIAPNFALGAVLMMWFAQVAARHMPDVEIVELHHDGKRDAPSGTALRTADLIAASREQTFDSSPSAVPAVSVHPSQPLPGARGAQRHGIHVHAVRLPGLVAHQEVLFGAQGQTLTIRHDALDRTAFLPGVLLAVREVVSRRGVIVGLERLLGLEVLHPFRGGTPPRDDTGGIP
ncbi:MAG: 4-hydroxy-tetrahydrodipicolinate reductase [Actinomycetota bacterium]|nr:4-hydroxy-tetrahydrodipicolinate reductase [Actinomycetota bacterium]